MTTQSQTKIKLTNVRLSFPSLFKRSQFDGNEGKFEATFLLDKSDTKTYNTIKKRIDQLLAENKVKVPEDKRCIKDGDDTDYDGYANHWSIKAGSNRRPTVINRDKTPLSDDDNVIYAGCYVNAIIDFWVQNNKYGKRVNANLYGVQFVKDGEPFGAGDVDVTDDFDEVDVDDVEDL